jgi:hypothetical protein
MSSQQPSGDGRMNGYTSNTYKIFANKVMKSQGEDIRRWARQEKNLLLKQLALEVLAIAGSTEKKEG